MTDKETMTEPHLLSYSRCASDEQCPYKRYLSREWGGTGLIPVLGDWDSKFGTVLHQGLDSIARGSAPDMRMRLEEAIDPYPFSALEKESWIALGQGLVYGLERIVWPYWMAEYDIVETEKMREWECAPGFIFRFRQDLLLKSKVDGHYVYIDYKSTSSNKPQWIASWAKSVQLHTSMYALKQSAGIEVSHAIVCGLYKGYKDEKIGFRRSPFTVGWANRQYAMAPAYSYEYQRGKGWELFHPWAEAYTTNKDWHDGMPESILSTQFPLTGPIPPRDDIAETYFRQQLIREREVQHAMGVLKQATTQETITDTLDRYFRQNFDHCEPAYGYDCEYKPLCWIPHVGADPLGSGQFERYKEAE